MKSWNNIEYSTVKYLLTVIALLSIVIGFFMGKVVPELFYTVVGGIISHFYQENTIKKLSKKVETQSLEIKMLNGSKTNIS